jgi:hypothetical protein
MQHRELQSALLLLVESWVHNVEREDRIRETIRSKDGLVRHSFAVGK